MSTESDERFNTQDLLKLQPVGPTFTFGRSIVFVVSLFRSNTVVPPTQAASTIVGVKVEQVSKNFTTKLCG